MVGVKLVDAETAQEVRSAINDKTAALAMVLSHNSLGHKVELQEMINIAHSAGLPLILDAAAEVPPKENLSRFVKMGADLVAFSGGKNLRGPQCSGILMGRKDLVRKAYVNSAPNNYFARIAKVGKEEIVGLLAAVELFLKNDEEAQRREYHAELDRAAARLKDVPTVFTELTPNDDYSHSPRLSVQWDEGKLGVTLDQMMKQQKGAP
jgi:L-seryl-tRNA(Ser) seleniumtransferase